MQDWCSGAQWNVTSVTHSNRAHVCMHVYVWKMNSVAQYFCEVYIIKNMLQKFCKKVNNAMQKNIQITEKISNDRFSAGYNKK
jgi:hypothetical protein